MRGCCRPPRRLWCNYFVMKVITSLPLIGFAPFSGLKTGSSSLPFQSSKHTSSILYHFASIFMKFARRISCCSGVGVMVLILDLVWCGRFVRPADIGTLHNHRTLSIYFCIFMQNFCIALHLVDVQEVYSSLVLRLVNS